MRRDPPLLYCLVMTPKLFKAADVCELAQVQPYVLRSWEKEFPGIGVQTTAEGARSYRQSDVEQVLRIKQLVFGEGLTLAGARRRLEQRTTSPERSAPPVQSAIAVPVEPVRPTAVEAEVAEVLDALAADARTRIASVREGLQSILSLLAESPVTRVVVVDDYALLPPPAATGAVAVGRVARNGSGSTPAVVGAKVPTARRKRASA